MNAWNGAVATADAQFEAKRQAILREAGFADVALFYAGLAFRGWVAYA